MKKTKRKVYKEKDKTRVVLSRPLRTCSAVSSEYLPTRNKNWQWTLTIGRARLSDTGDINLV